MDINNVSSLLSRSRGKVTEEISEIAHHLGLVILSYDRKGHILANGLHEARFDLHDTIYIMADGSLTQEPRRDADYILSPIADTASGQVIDKFTIEARRDILSRSLAKEFRIQDMPRKSFGIILAIPEMIDQEAA